jgi:tetratricopeptide (TPR) repeat protein
MNLRNGLLLLLILSVFMTDVALSQNTGKTVRKRRVVEESPESAQLNRAYVAIQKQDFAAAEKDLLQITEQDPKNAHAWSSLGYVYNATNRTPQAIEAYRKSVEADPQVFETALNLGLLLARAKDAVGAEKYLRQATTLKPAEKPEEGLYIAWRTLGEVLRDNKPADAVQAFRSAAAVAPNSPEPHVAAAFILENQNQLSDAAAEFQKAAELDPRSSEALAGLVNSYSKLGKYTEAESALRKYLQLDPNNVTAHVQLGRLLAAQQKWDEATAELEIGLKVQPNDVSARKEIANMYMAQKKYADAAPHLRTALESAPNDADLHHSMGVVLMNQRQFPEAQNELMTAVKLKPDLGEAYGNLAIVASANQNYPLTLQALDARAKTLPENPGTYFLRATAFDHMKDSEHAAENYRRFLEAAQGRYPDEEWKAKHRLIAIEPQQGKSKKK